MLTDLIEDLKRDEGWRPSVYDDHLGFATIGYGFLVDERRGGELPVSIAEVWLRLIIEKRWKQLIEAESWVKDQPEDVRRALMNMAYQLGIGGLCRFKKMLAALEAGDRVLAAGEALNSRWAKQTPKRATRVAALIRGTNR